MNKTVEIKDVIRNFIHQHSFKDTSGITENTLLFKEGIFDSMGFVLLIDFLEERFGIITQDKEMIEENFESINALADFVQMRQI